MHSIGNDIVDLNLAKTQSNWQRKGFLEKQFTKQEQGVIYSSKNPFLKVWQFWSMKEAAYKCYTQKVKKRFFAPQKFECSLTTENKGTVFFEGNKYHTNTNFSTFYICTVAKETTEKIIVFSEIRASKTVNADLIIKLAEESGISLKEIEKRKTVVGAPLFYHHKQLLTKSCSISHHGNYAAFAFTLNNEA